MNSYRVYVDSVTTSEAKAQLSRLLARVEAGEEIAIRRGAHEVARLVPVAGRSGPARPKVGTVTSRPVGVSDDAFAPLAEDELASWGL